MYAELRHLDGACAGQTRLVRKEFATIGRHPSADVQFDPDRDLDVSGRHAAIFRQGEGWTLRDLGSSNGTWVNGARLRGDRALAANDVIRFGPKGPQLQFVPQQGDPATIPLTQREPALRRHAEALPRIPAAAPAQAERREAGAVTTPTGGPPGRTTERIRVEVRRQTAPWRRAAVGFGLLVLLGGAAATLLLLKQSRALEAERRALLARTDTLLGQLGATSSSVAALEAALQRARQETQRLRASLQGKGVNAERLDSLSRELASSVTQHDAVLRAAQLDAGAIAQQNGDALGLMVIQFPDGRVVAGTGFVVRVRGDTGWVVTSRHLVRDASGARAARLGIIFNGSNQNFRAELAAIADSADLALLTVRVRGGVPVVRGIAAGAQLGDPVAIVGFPYGFDFPQGADWRRLGVSASRFTGTVRRIRDDAIEVDGYGASGSSGSPVFNAAGEVTGVVYGGDPATAGRIVYAVPVAVLRRFLEVER